MPQDTPDFYYINASATPPTIIARFPRIANVPRRDMEDLVQALSDARDAATLDDQHAAHNRIEHILNYHMTDEWQAATVEQRIRQQRSARAGNL